MEKSITFLNYPIKFRVYSRIKIIMSKNKQYLLSILCYNRSSIQRRFKMNIKGMGYFIGGINEK